jgi:CheY-like chemotaxis protein
MGNEKGKVLVVDDQRVLRLSLAGIIEDHGYEVTDVEDGYQAIEAVRATDYDLVFMDIKMPGIDGFATFEAIKDMNPEARVIFMTGFVVDDSLREALDAGAYPIAYKPLDIENLCGLLAQISAGKVKLPQGQQKSWWWKTMPSCGSPWRTSWRISDTG